jgi:hypothetical protein
VYITTLLIPSPALPGQVRWVLSQAGYKNSSYLLTFKFHLLTFKNIKSRCKSLHVKMTESHHPNE